jgi:SSS family solute:Na+ symporter
LGVAFKRLNGQGALAALITGFALGLFRLAVDTPVKLEMGSLAGGYAEGSFLWVVNNMFYQYYSLIILVICIAVMVGVSMATRKPDYASIGGLTFGTVTDDHRQESRRSWGRGDVIASVMVLLCILAAYLYFRG